jgi:hypothetical protein
MVGIFAEPCAGVAAQYQAIQRVDNDQGRMDIAAMNARSSSNPRTRRTRSEFDSGGECRAAAFEVIQAVLARADVGKCRMMIEPTPLFDSLVVLVAARRRRSGT